MSTNGTLAHQEQQKAAEQAGSAAAVSNAPNRNLSKDEISWFFVEQYYKTSSRTPEKLHLFYGKRSQFVYGLEAEKTNVSVGRQAIQERIKALDLQDVKVRVTNVDSQASYDNILVQVIGDISIQNGEPRKFVQTFILAQQPSGYFVLNDIFRYINEDEAEEEESTPPRYTPTDVPEPASTAVEPEALEVGAKEELKLDANVVDEKVKQAATDQIEIPVNGGDIKEIAEKPDHAAIPPVAVADEPAQAEPAEPKESEKAGEAEEAGEASTSPAAKAKQEAAPEQVMPPKPMTWASRAAAAAGPRPVVPLQKTATPPSQSQHRVSVPVPASASAPASAATAPSTTAPTAAAPAAAPPSPPPAPAQVPTPAAVPTVTPAMTIVRVPPTASNAAQETASTMESSGWQTAGADSKRQNRPQSISASPAEKESLLIYVKFVTGRVRDIDLRNALAAHGTLAYFDINRLKNCAFVEYETLDGYQAALAANPYVVNGVEIVVEPRRPKSSTYGGNTFNAGRGNNSGGRGRGGFDGNRNGPANQRGNFPAQHRGRGNGGRGRAGAQANV